MIDKNRIIEPQPVKGPDIDRRQHTRWALDRPCKVRRASSITFEIAQTQNVSPGGTRLVVSGQKRFVVGDRVEIAVAWDSQPVLISDCMIVGKVVRTMTAQAGQTLAIQFERTMDLDAAVLDPAA